MCDTLVALSNSTKNKVTIFAKNSDRRPNESQIVEYIPAKEHDTDTLRCTYITIPQVKRTNASIISRPFWMWGAEMGVNEYGLAIGNEAVFTKMPYSQKGLTGMDMLRLALERCKTSEEALNLIIEMLEKYGQGGNCGYQSKLYYHNSYIIADPRDAWILETAGKLWVAKKVRDVASISNALTIDKDWDRAHPDLINYAIEKGWCKDEEDFSFSKCYTSWFLTYFSKGRYRQRFTLAKLEQKRGELDLNDFMEIMRSHHYEGKYNPVYGSMKDICMHAGGITRPSQTAGSMIVELYEETPVIWVTATSIPCLSIYKPVFFEAGLPYLGPSPKGEFNGSYWWRHELLMRKVQTNYSRYSGDMRKEIMNIERSLQERTKSLRDEFIEGEVTNKDLFNLSQEAFKISEEFDRKWLDTVRAGKTYNLFYNYYWWRVNRRAKVRL